MVDFAALSAMNKRLREESIFVGYCRICDTQSKIYEENIMRLNDDSKKDIFRCPRCNAGMLRDDLIPF